MKTVFSFIKLSTLVIVFLAISVHEKLLSENKLTREDDLRIFKFNSEKAEVLPGLSTENVTGYNCTGKLLDGDKIGNLAIVAMFYQNGCYTDGQYNHNNYKIEVGTVTDSENQFSFDAYKVHGPSKKAANFLASKHCISYKFKDKQDYTIYQLKDGKINKVVEILAENITPGDYILIKELIISEIIGAEVYFFAPSKTRLSIYNQYSNTVEGAMVKSTSIADIQKYRYQSIYVPFDPAAERYTNTRQFFLLKTSYGKVNAIWQDEEGKSILMTQFSKDLKSETTIKLPNVADAQLVAATNDSEDNYYYLVIEDRSSKSGTDVATLYKVGKNGYLIKKAVPDVSKSGLDIYSFGNYMADLQYLDGKLGLFIARTMFASSDGLNHQGGIAVLFDANTLSVIRNFGQTSGHSFDNYLTINSNNEFLGIDLGDNYPRGINLHKFTDNRIYSKVVYTFKTEHGKHFQSPAGKTYPAYTEISTPDKKYYKWSNDNGTYTSLGAVIEVDDGYLVLFTGEPDASGKSINNARVGKDNTDSRNVGFVKIVKDFETKSGRGDVVSDDMVLSKGASETGGFYTFGGWFAEQRNTGVQWLTKYKERIQETAVHLKAVKLSDGNILLLWEKMTVDGYNQNYKSTVALKIDKNGRKLSEEIDLGSHVRLTRRDEPLVLGNNLIIAGGNKAEKKLELVVLEMK